jgi:DNA-binding IscR family transcriptional regulator
VHAVWQEAQEKMMEVLNRRNFAELAQAEKELLFSIVPSP